MGVLPDGAYEHVVMASRGVLDGGRGGGRGRKGEEEGGGREGASRSADVMGRSFNLENSTSRPSL